MIPQSRDAKKSVARATDIYLYKAECTTSVNTFFNYNCFILIFQGVLQHPSFPQLWSKLVS